MPQLRHLGATVAIVAALLLVFSTIAVARPGPGYGPRGFDTIWFGTQEADEFPSGDADNSGRDKLFGRAGDDTIDAGDKRDLVKGGLGDDTIAGGDGSDLLLGKAGDDLLYGGEGNDRIRGGRGDDRIRGNAGNDIIAGGQGADRIAGGPGHDRIRGNAGNDTIYAVDGSRDWIGCGPGEDTVFADDIDRVARNCENIVPTPGEE
jgi:Ca2+-binding RTX toxin-like protein